MKIGLVGYQGSGKSTLFHWLTEIEPDLSAAHSGQSAMATIQDERIEQLCTIYEPKKITRASLEIFDTPGLNHHICAERGPFAEESAKMLQSFFRLKRTKSKGDKL